MPFLNSLCPVSKLCTAKKFRVVAKSKAGCIFMSHNCVSLFEAQCNLKGQAGFCIIRKSLIVWSVVVMEFLQQQSNTPLFHWHTVPILSDYLTAATGGDRRCFGLP